MVDQFVPPSVDLSILYPVIAEPPLFDGAVQERLICDEETVVAVNAVGDDGAVAVVETDAFTSIAASSHASPLPLAVHLQVTKPGDAGLVEVDAPVIALGILVSHLCVQVGLPSVTPP